MPLKLLIKDELHIHNQLARKTWDIFYKTVLVNCLLVFVIILSSRTVSYKVYSLLFCVIPPSQWLLENQLWHWLAQNGWTKHTQWALQAQFLLFTVGWHHFLINCILPNVITFLVSFLIALHLSFLLADLLHLFLSVICKDKKELKKKKRPLESPKHHRYRCGLFIFTKISTHGSYCKKLILRYDRFTQKA